MLVLSNRLTCEESRATSGLRFECTQCGKCCTRRGRYAHVYVTDDEARGLATLLGVSLARFRRRYTFTDEYGWEQLRFEGDACPFLEVSSKRCKVYDRRPVQCRTFPFWEEMVDEHGWTEKAKSYCEGLGHGRVWPRAEVESSMRAMRESD